MTRRREEWGSRSDVTILDGHARLPASAPADVLIAAMDRSGIGRAIVSAGSVIPLSELRRNLAQGTFSTADPDNASVLDARDAHPERIIPFHFGNPHRGVDSYVRDAGDYAGLELSPAVHGLPWDDARLDDWFEAATAVGHPVYVVCLERPGTRVDDLVRRAGRHPGLRLVLGHAGTGPMDLEAAHVIAPHPDIVLETSCAFFVVLQQAVAVLGPERVMFGSEFPHQHPAAELAKVDALDLSPTDWDWVTSRTGDRLLNPQSDVRKEAS